MSCAISSVSTVPSRGSTVASEAGEDCSVPDTGSQLRQLAAAEDQNGISIATSVDTLRQKGWLARCLPVSHGGQSVGAGGSQARESVLALAGIAEYNLSLGRLLEGHVNALGLIFRWGSADMQSRVAEQVKAGLLLGVWGADADEPVCYCANSHELTGSKRYASGLGVVGKAVVTARTRAGVQLCLVDVAEAARADASRWQMTGMQASASGHYDMAGIGGGSVETLGMPDTYQIEPWFHGGVWRIASVQIGGVFGVLELARENLRQLGRLDNDAHVGRLAPLLYRALAARELIHTVAGQIDETQAPADPEALVSMSIFTRLLTEEIGLDTIREVERSAGLSMFESGSHVGRQCRDLATYLRQAASDGLLQRAGRTQLLSNEPLSGSVLS